MLKSRTTEDGYPVDSLSPGSEKKVILSCDDCGAESKIAYSNYRSSQLRYQRNGETYCRPCSNKRNGKNKRGGKIASAPKSRSGSQSVNYSGGRWIASDGYVMVLISPRHYQREHILVMENEIGRPVNISDGELVHHIDLDKTNNISSNLVLLSSELDHKAAHKSLNSFLPILVKNELVKYDRQSNSYIASESLLSLLKTEESV